MKPGKTVIAACEADLRVQLDIETLNQAQIAMEESISGLMESIEGCFDAVDASMKRLEETLDQMFRSVPAQDSSDWTN